MVFDALILNNFLMRLPWGLSWGQILRPAYPVDSEVVKKSPKQNFITRHFNDLKLGKVEFFTASQVSSTGSGVALSLRTIHSILLS
jgi:hypothetical protein